jgi:hypothetical protein
MKKIYAISLLFLNIQSVWAIGYLGNACSPSNDSCASGCTCTNNKCSGDSCPQG